KPERGEPDAALPGRIRKQTRAEVPEQAVRLEVEIGDDEIGTAVAVVVPGVNTHTRPRLPVGGDGDAGLEGRLDEMQIARLPFHGFGAQGVAEEKVGDAV